MLLTIKIIKLQSPSMSLLFLKASNIKGILGSKDYLQAPQTLSPATSLWMHHMPDHGPHPVTTIAIGLPLTCQNRHGLEACLIPCPLPGTPSTLLWIPGGICLLRSRSLPWSPLLRGEPRLLNHLFPISKAIFLLISLYTTFLGLSTFLSISDPGLPVWFHLPLH